MYEHHHLMIMNYKTYPSFLKHRTAYRSVCFTIVRMLLAVILLLGAGTAIGYAQQAENQSDTTAVDTSATPASEKGGAGEQTEEEPKSFLEKIFPFLGGDDDKSSKKQKKAKRDTTNPYEHYSQEELNYAYMQAASNNNLDRMMDLLNEGAIINARDQHGRTALMEAARLGHYQVVKTLIQYGATVNAKDIYDGTALRYATKEGNVDIVNLLQKNGAQR